MKKMFMVLAATLICGACLFTSCGKDDNDDEPTPQPTPEVNNNVYEVNLTAIVHDCSAPYLMIDLEYTDADGVKHTATVKNADATDTILPEALAYYNKVTAAYRTNAEDEELFTHYKVKNFKMTVAAGKSFSFKGTCAAVPNYTAPTEEFSMIRPMVLVNAKRVSGEGEDVSQEVKSTFIVNANMGTAPKAFKSAMTVYVGSNCGEGAFTF